MTVPNAVDSARYVATGSDATYQFTYRIFSEEDLLVQVQTAAGVVSTLILNTDYTVDGVGNYGGGSITLTAGNLTVGYVILIIRDPALVQDISLQTQGAYNPAAVESGLDYLTMIAQDQQTKLDKSIHGPLTDASTVSMALPAAALRALGFLAFDSGGNAVIATGTPGTTPVTAFGAALIADADAAAGRVTLGNPPQSVATLAALRGLVTTNLAGNVILSTYATAGDDGGGLFYWSAGSSATDNSGTIVKPTSVSGAGRWLRYYGQVIKPEWFGAVGDGTTNDAVAIQSCLTLLATGGQARGMLLTRQYAIGSGGWVGLTLTSATDVTIYAETWEAGFKLLAAPSQSVQGITTQFLIDGCTRVQARGFKCDLNNLEHSAISLHGCTDCDVSQTYATNSPNAVLGDNRPAYVFHSSTGCSLRDNHAYSVSAWFYFGMSTALGQITDCSMERNIFRSSKSTNAANATRSVINGNVFDTCLYAGIELGGTSAAAMVDWVISNNTFKSCTAPTIQVSSLSGTPGTAHGVITGNTISGGLDAGIEMFGGILDVVVSNNIIRDTVKGVVITVPGTGTQGGCKHITIVGNQIYDTRAAGARTTTIAVELALGTSSGGAISGEQLGNISIIGNLFRNLTDTGIITSYTSGAAAIAGLAIRGNTITDCSAQGVSFSTGFAGGYTNISISDNQLRGNTNQDFRFSLNSTDAPTFILSNNQALSGTPYNFNGGYAPLFVDLVGTGSPETVVFASPGSMFHRTDGGTTTSLYIKTGAGNSASTWTAK